MAMLIANNIFNVIILMCECKTKCTDKHIIAFIVQPMRRTMSMQVSLSSAVFCRVVLSWSVS